MWGKGRKREEEIEEEWVHMGEKVWWEKRVFANGI